MLFLFRKPKVPATQTNAEARRYWESRETAIRLYFAIITMVLIVVGIEVSAPKQHLSQVFMTYLAETTATGHWLFSHDWVSAFFVTHRDELTKSLVYSGGTAKAVAMSLIFIIAFVYAIGNDPLSNSQLLRNLAGKLDDESRSQKLPLYTRLMPELQFYAKNMPSKRVDSLCQECAGHVGCGNGIGKRPTDNPYTLWTTIYYQLPTASIHDLLFRTNRCRAAFLLRYAFWCAALVLVFVYPAARVFEFVRGAEMQLNTELILYIGFLIGASYVLGWIMYGNAENSRGFWGHLKDAVDHLIGSQEFCQLFERNICHRQRRLFHLEVADVSEKIPGSQLQRLLTLIHFLDMLVERKAVAVVAGPSAKAPVPHLTNILFSLTEMFHQLGNKKHVFRAVLLSNSPSLDYLDPVVFTTSRNGGYLTLTNPTLIQQNLSKKADSIAMRAIESGATVSAVGDTIPRFHEGQSKYQKSIIAYPIVFRPKLRNALLAKTSDAEFPSPAAILVIDTTDETCFSKDNEEVNEILIRPFAMRIMFEMAVASVRLAEGAK